MYEYLQGLVVQRGPTQVVLDVNGVGYDLQVPLSADFGGPLGSEDPIKVWTHLVVRENAHLLYGFPSPALRELFRLLLKVRGVGPTMALGVLSGLSAEELLAAIAAKDPTPLQRIKGVGKKTAEQILLDLQDRAPRLAQSIGAGGVLTPSAPAGGGAIEDAIGALISIGYTEKEAAKCVAKAAKSVGSENLDTLLRSALRQ